MVRFNPYSVALGLLLYLIVFHSLGRADDWPQWRGPNRDGVWNETGILRQFPPTGLKIQWRAPIGPGWSSPIVAQGRVYVVDSELMAPKAKERVHCFDEKTGHRLWTYSYDVAYPDWAFTSGKGRGPTATPMVHDGRLYTVGNKGDLLCLDATNGNVIWKRNL
ncbi:MAG TPA: PQQ-binding-like beta-propeller repeat protein [Gemmataceae bacterium]|nr:PQQ-binding-like beta-propeller repeat protein [Gemmataceae bacterium]